MNLEPDAKIIFNAAREGKLRRLRVSSLNNIWKSFLNYEYILYMYICISLLFIKFCLNFFLIFL